MSIDIPFFIHNFKKDKRLRNLDNALKKAIKDKLPYQFFIFYFSSYIDQHVFTYKNFLKVNPVEQEYLYNLLLKKKFNFTDNVLQKFLKDNFSLQKNYFFIYPIVVKRRFFFSLVISKSLNQEEQNFLAGIAEKILFFYDYLKTKNQEVIYEKILGIYTLQQFLRCIKTQMRENILFNKLLVFLQQNKTLIPLNSKKIPLTISKKINLEKLKRSKTNCYLEEVSSSTSQGYEIPSSLVIAFPLNEKDSVIFYLEKKVKDYFDDWEIDYLINWQEMFQKHLVKKITVPPTMSQQFFSAKTKKLEMLLVSDPQKDIIQDSATLTKNNFKISRLSYFAFLTEDDSLPYQKKNLDYCLHHYFSLKDLVNQLLKFQANDLFSKNFLDYFFLLDVENEKDRLAIISSNKIQIYAFSFKTGELIINKKNLDISTFLNSKIEFLEYSWDNLVEQNLLLFFDSPLKKEMINGIKEKLILLGDLSPTILLQELKQEQKLTANCLAIIKVI